jgi:phosphonate C-P lyase system protein PhnG
VTPERRSEGLAAAARALRPELLDAAELIVQGGQVEVTEPPKAGSVMVELASPVGDFCFTEVVVTTAGVRLAGRPGWACVLGYDEEAALAGAVLDAVQGQEVERLAERALAAEAQQSMEEARAVASTRVGDGDG